MAYNPFDFFRKNQKIFFAVITIFVMFTFVLSFGQGDFFSWFPKWLGAQKSSGEVLAEVDGGKLRDSDVARVNDKRVLANTYMSQLADLQWRAITQKVQDTQLGAGKVSEEARRAIEFAQSPYQNLLRTVQFRQQLGMGGPGPEYPEQMREALLMSRNELGKVITRPDLKSDDREAAQAQDRLMRAQLDQIARAVSSGGRRDDAVYFATMPNRHLRDRLEYLLWLKKADRLGIRYTREDVDELVKREVPDVRDDERLKLAAETVTGRERRASADALYEALGDEFRVRAAQAAVLGTSQVRLNGGLHTPAPQELFDFYKRQTAPTRYTFLTVPVGPFAAQVLGEPTEAELKKIYADYRYVEPDPSNPKAGIKEPRKVSVAWAEITGAEAYYGPLAEDRLKKATDSRLSLLFTLPLGAGVLGNAVAPIGFTDLRYDAYKTEQGEVAKGWAARGANPGLPRLREAAGAVLGGWPVGDPANDTRPFSAPQTGGQKLADASVAKPHNVGVLAGLLGGAFATGGSLLTAPVVMTETGYAVEKEQRLLAGIQAFHFPTLPGLPVLGELTGADMAVLAALPQPLPQPLVQPLLDARSKDDLRAKAAADDARDFQKQLADVMKKDDQTAAVKEAADLTAKFIKDRGLKTDATTDLRDMHTLADAPALAPLVPKSGVADPILRTLSNPVRKSTFGYTLLMQPRPPRTLQEAQSAQPLFEPAVGVYAPVPYPPQRSGELPEPSEAAPLTLVWRTAETKAEAPREYNDPQVIERCKAVWKRLKARDLARKACEEVATQAQEAGDSPARLNQRLLDAEKALQERLKPGFGVRLISDFKYDIAPLVKESERSPTMMGGGNGLRAFGPALLQGDDFVYPTFKMTDDLLANRDKPVGTAVVLADQPETTLYVAVITGKDQADPSVFRNMILRPSAPVGLGADPREVVIARHAADARKQARDEAVALLKAEFGYANEHPDLDKRAASETAE